MKDQSVTFPIEGKRLSLVPFTEEYLTIRYVSWLNNPDVVRYSEQRHRHHTLESCQAYFSSFAEGENEFIAILEKSLDYKHIGNLSTAVDLPNSVADISIMIGEPDAWGNGYGLEAWSLMMEHLFTDLKIRKVTAGTMSVNKPMLAIMKASGMQFDGRRVNQFLIDDQETDLIHSAKFRKQYPMQET